MQAEGMSGKGVALRFLAALVLVYGSFNPEGYSFFHWALAPVLEGDTAAAGANVPLKLLAALVLIGGWGVFVQATRRSIGWKGGLLILAIVAVIVWALIDWNLLTARSSRAIGHLALVGLTIVLALGMTWSHVSRKLTGQVDTDDVQ